MTTRGVPLRLRYREVPRLPRLAWVATIDRAAGDVLVFHGSAVECREEWMVEGVWDAEFRSGGFHESPHFFGSGLRLADGCLYCVPSSALVNRLMYCVHRDRVLRGDPRARTRLPRRDVRHPPGRAGLPQSVRRAPPGDRLVLPGL